MRTPEEILKQGNEGHSLRDVINGLTDEQIIECFHEYKNQFSVSEITDEQIEEREKLVNPYNPNMFKVGFQQGYVKGAKWMRSKLTNK